MKLAIAMCLVFSCMTASAMDRIYADGFDGNDVCTAPPGMTRLTSGVVTYTAGGGTRRRDLTLFNQIWGHNTSSDAEITWPGRQPSTPILTMPRFSYVAAQFTVPIGETALGFIQRTTYSYGIDMTASYSVRCGDFNPVDSACLSVADGSTGAIPFPSWSVNLSNQRCNLVEGQTYYLNIMATNPLMSWAGCPANYPSCPMGTNNLFGEQK